MLKKYLHKKINNILIKYYIRKFGSIWKLKSHIQKQNIPDQFLLYAYNHYFSKFGSWIGYNSEFSGEPCFPHGPWGVFISGGAKIGKNVVIFQQVTIGSNTLNDTKGSGSPLIGNNVYIGAGAKIIGGIKISDNCRIGANAVVYKDMPPHSVAVQYSTRIIQKQYLDNRYYSMKNGRWVFFDNGNWIEDSEKRV